MSEKSTAQHPNILLIVVDQYRYPRFSYGPEGGFAEPLKEILGFRGPADVSGNPYAEYFPGLTRLRRNAVALHNHTIASSACTPSRAVMFTGQYGTRTGVTQTDGMFKDGNTPTFPWLQANGYPTLGHWMRAVGYSSHYFGKWHVSNPPGHSLNRFGFSDWELSYPEPHGAAINNLGIYRDPGFADNACLFLRRRGLALPYDYATSAAEARGEQESPAIDATQRPWFAVVSFTNPHDIATYPTVVSQALPQTEAQGAQDKPQSAFGPLDVPDQGQSSFPPNEGTMTIPLNPQGFPQDCAGPIPTWDEDLSSKPVCQFDAAYKIGLALSAKASHGAVQGITNGHDDGKPDTGVGREDWSAAVKLALKFTIPFQLSEHPEQYSIEFLQFYGWLHSQVDPQINRVLQSLEESGQAENTIVLFVADHGELGAAHNMMLEKWHVAYQEAVHVPMVVQFPPSMRSDDGLTHVDAVTSHADLVPTILGLTGVGPEALEKAEAELAERHRMAPLPGVDLTPTLKVPGTPVTYPGGRVREGVLFITDDEVTEPTKGGRLTEPDYFGAFEVYCQTVEAVRTGGHGAKEVPGLAPGPVRQPNHIRCVRTKEAKLSRYFDPSNPRLLEWEMYDLVNDPNEIVNLVKVRGDRPIARTDLDPKPGWYDEAEVQAAANRLAVLLAELEARDLSVPEHAVPA
ncbi:sulfatase-like hydrolase/transferase [Azospirillum sp. B510]|uniref:sulfatase-like hydrolase/transferase n=1 Tax=Azospirillum sp. (strain B510) TaxID=137722 RepID=UPI0003010D40|nr:sulfatase-like hydrolase/transferase [Azospirillum sp. B510]